MTVRTEQFQTPETITLRVSLPVGHVQVIAEPTAVTTVSFDGDSATAAEIAARATIELTGRELVVSVPDRAFRMFRRYRDFSVTIRLPENSALVASLGSSGILARAGLKSASGALQVADVTGDVKAKSASGSLTTGHVCGRAELRTASGEIRAAAVDGDLNVHTASGAVTVGSAGAAVSVRTASGEISVGSLRQGTAELHSASGAIRAAVAQGTGVWLDVSSMSGNAYTDLNVTGEEPAGGHQLRLMARSLSGNVQVTRAA
jgi:hypothetical protein